ncbi:MAG TPA: carboxypeptidase-like regulatory domain-containing protein [Stellaceae bacterium]|nr:carboxypeptidase-like regulatory domain-containing protein [Stellaceae bacterium]
MGARILPRIALLAALALALPTGPARAGGGSFDNGAGEDDSRATLFGFVKTRDGDAVDDAKVTITMTKLNASLVVRTDADGHFLAKLFYREVDPKDLDLACGKDGYHEVTLMRRPPLAAGAPIEIDCVLEKQ